MRVNIEMLGGAIGSITLLGGAPPGEWPARSGTWGLERNGLEGWYDSAEPRVPNPVDIPGMNGSYWPEELLAQSRIVTLRGFFSLIGSQASEITLGNARDIVSEFQGKPVRVTVSDEIGDRFVTGYVSSQVTFSKASEAAFKFSIIVTCPDPVKYGTVSRVDLPAGRSTAVFNNSGRAAVSPVVTALGYITSLSVNLGGRSFVWVGATDSLVIDLLDGVPRDASGRETGTVVHGEAISLQPGESKITVDSDQGTTWSIRAGWL